MQIPRSYIENYSKSLNIVSETAQKKLVDALSKIDYTADVADIRNAVIAVMQSACNASTSVSARLAAEFYDGLRERFGIDDDYEAEAESLRDPAATDGAVRAFAQDIVDEKPIESFIGSCADRLDYETRRAANECVAYNAKNDPKKPRWARIPTGPETCPFCIMLASRGFTYQSKETASHAHANCDCRIVPSWDKAGAEGYDPALYYDMWKNPDDYPELQEARNARRRELYTEKKAEQITERQQLERDARAVVGNQAKALGITEQEARRRFDALVNENTDAQLRRYIKKYRE